jgi:hypothetical protein
MLFRHHLMLLLDRRLPNDSVIEIAQGHHIELKERRMEDRRDVHWMTIASLITDLDKDNSRSITRTIDSPTTKGKMAMAATVGAIQEIAEISTATGIEMTTMTTNDVAREADHLKEHHLAHLAVVPRKAGNMVSGLKESKSHLVGMCLLDNQMEEMSDMMDTPNTTHQQYARS